MTVGGRGAVVIGIGNPYRRDDGVAVAVLARLREVGPDDVRYLDQDGEPTRLIDGWTGADLAVVVDACRSGAPPGTVHRVDLRREQIPAKPAAISGHTVGLTEAVQLAAALDRLPGRLLAVAVEAADLDTGAGLTDPVAAAVPEVVAAVLAELAASGRSADAGELVARQHEQGAGGAEAGAEADRSDGGPG